MLDELTRAGVRARLVAVFFTHGDRRTVTQDGRQVGLGKAWLVSRLQALLQGSRLHLPGTAEAAALGRELLDYEIKIDEDANDRYGAFRTGAHDDLVTALGLACQDEPPRPFTPAAAGRRPVYSPTGAPPPEVGRDWRGDAGELPVEAQRRR